MKQQADKELVAIRRILDTLNNLVPSHRKRVLAFVIDRIDNPPVEVATTPPLADVPFAPRVGLTGVTAALPFPNAELVKKAVADMAAGTSGNVLVGSSDATLDLTERGQ